MNTTKLKSFGACLMPVALVTALLYGLMALYANSDVFTKQQGALQPETGWRQSHHRQRINVSGPHGFTGSGRNNRRDSHDTDFDRLRQNSSLISARISSSHR